jgi:purine-binding chemotaxis protein CheW
MQFISMEEYIFNWKKLVNEMTKIHVIIVGGRITDLANNLIKELYNMDSSQLVVFTLGVEEYAIPISFAQEIIRIPVVTKVPSIPEFIEGVFNLRGRVIPVVDLKKRFGFGKSEKCSDNRLLVLELDGMQLGIIVDDVLEVISIDENLIESLSDEIMGISKNSIQGISLVRERIIMVLDAIKLKSDIFKNNLEKELVV